MKLESRGRADLTTIATFKLTVNIRLAVTYLHLFTLFNSGLLLSTVT